MKPWLKWTIAVFALLLVGYEVWYLKRKYSPVRDEVPLGPIVPRLPVVPDGIFWPDGSLNFQAGLEESRRSPEEVLKSLREVPPAEVAPRDTGKAAILVFPFRDATTAGVGVPFTQGWHMMGTAALAQWTNAKLLSPAGLWSCSAPRWDQLTAGPKTTAQWAEYIRSQQPVPSDAVVISGVMRDGDTTTTAMAEFFWLKPGEAEPQPLFTDKACDGLYLDGMLESQRREARMLADEVVKAGLATENKGFGKAPEAELEAELRRIVIAANARHSWVAQEAVNRALLLARRYPTEHAPLQAAAYALMAVRMPITPDWTYARREDTLSALRAVAVAQLASQLAPTVGGPAVVTHFSLLTMNFDTDKPKFDERMSGYMQLANLKTVPEQYGMGAVKELPDWLLLLMLRQNVWYFGSTGLIPFRDALLRERKDCDIMGSTMQDGFTQAEGGKAFTSKVGNSDDSYQEDVQNFLALNLCLLAAEDTSRTATLAEAAGKLGAGTPVKTDGIGPDDFLQVRGDLEPARAGWAKTALREAGRWSAWDSLGTVYQDLFDLCVGLRAHPPAALAQPAASSFEGIEYTPARRWREYSLRLEFGITRYLGFIRRSFGSIDMWQQTSAGLEPRMTEPGSPFWIQNVDYITPNAMKGNEVEAARKVMQETAAACPWDWQSLQLLATTESREGDPEAAVRMISECERLGRNNAYIFRWLAGFYQSLGANRLAIQYYARYLKWSPKAYDVIGNYWALRTALGDTTPHLRELQNAADAVRGNPEVVSNLIHYQVYSLKDYKGARESCQHYGRFRSVDPRWPLEIALAAGDTSDTAKLVEAMVPDTRNSIALSKFHAHRATAYRKIGLLKEAEAELQKAEGYDYATGDVMEERMELAYEKKEWVALRKRAMAREDRYGVTDVTRARVAESYWGQDRREEAVKVLTDYLKSNPRDVTVASKLIRFLAAMDRKAEATEVLDWFLAAPGINGDRLDGAIKNFAAIDPARAAQLKRDRNKILGGPATVDGLLDVMARRREAKLPSVLR